MNHSEFQKKKYFIRTIRTISGDNLTYYIIFMKLAKTLIKIINNLNTLWSAIVFFLTSARHEYKISIVIKIDKLLIVLIFDRQILQNYLENNEWTNSLFATYGIHSDQNRPVCVIRSYHSTMINTQWHNNKETIDFSFVNMILHVAIISRTWAYAVRRILIFKISRREAKFSRKNGRYSDTSLL